jgi:hypothetical protein
MNLDEPPVFAGNVVPTQNLNRHSEERNARMDKKRMTRASVMLFCLLCFQFVLTQAAVAQQKPLTSEKLSIDDVKPHLEKILKSRNATLQQVFGVHQEGNQATVYYLAEGPSIFGVPGSGGPGSKSPAVGGPGAEKRGPLKEQLRLVRFNSGEWFDPQHQSFVVK